MSTQHTQLRVKVQHPHAGERGFEVAYEPGLEQVCQNVTEANARRIVACWNACAGIETYALELMTGDLSIHSQLTRQRQGKMTPKAVEYRKQRDELLKALQACDEAMSYMSEYDIPLHLPFRVKAAIAKAAGGAA